ncbi:phage terminase small subunit P27 family [Saccharopolyspora sp. 6T]|uniref:phage terminase small subunit P27 family n=1 Tax=Saccharopolyspora sp. 6T TaxID=2877238 RepID=UPI001CD72B56|nr:phage terminase small subunit P27 family [Saccharopolyspora sp. 6T]MCA1185718.1 phage terminase small subunit P27 family [Saccharopolyspora sp. 6T]
MGRGGQGRPSKPTALKILHGDQKSRINVDEPIPDLGEIRPPEWLVLIDGESPDGAETALDVWNRMVPDLIAKGVLTPWDVEGMAVYCDAVIKHRQASIEVARNGMTIQGSQGTTKNPAVTAMKDCAELMNRYGAKFGLSPSDRANLSLKGDDDGSKGAGRLLG